MISGLSGYLKGVKKAIGNIGHGNQPTTPTLGRIRIGNREVEEIKLIAQGGYAYVFKVRDVQTNEIFALKKMVCQSPERLSTAKNEINMLRSLPQHPNLLEVFDSFVEQKDHCYYVYVLLEFCADGSIFDLMEKYESTRLSEKQIIFIMREVCEGVKVLHSMNPPVAHRDLKIENVLLSNKKFKLCDFGSCSRSVVDFAKIPQNKYNDYEEEYDKNCTLMYRPPEMCDPYLKQIVCEKVDIWMIGCILYTMCFYKHPFQEMTKLSIVNAAYTFPTEHPYPQKMIDLIRLLLTPNPRTRPSIYEACELFQNYFSFDSIKLNADAIKVREEQKKQAMELKKFESGSSRKFNGDIPEDELMKLQQKLAKTDFYGDNDDPSPIHDHNQKSHHRKNSSNGSLKAQAKTNFEDFGSFGGNKPNKVELTHFNSSPGLGSQQGNDWYNFGSTTSKSSSSNQQTQQGQQKHHQSAQTSSFGQAKNAQSQQATDPKVNEQWKNFDFNSVPQNSSQSNNNNNNNNLNNANKTAQSWGNNNSGNPNQPQPTMNKPVPQQQNLQNLYQQQGQQGNVQNQGWNQNINQAQFASNNRVMQPQPQNNFQAGFNQQMNPQNMNKGNAGWNNFGNVPQNNMMNNNMNSMNYQNNNNNNFGYNNMGGQKPIQQNAPVTVTNNLLDLADTQPKRLDTATGIMSLYGSK